MPDTRPSFGQRAVHDGSQAELLSLATAGQIASSRAMSHDAEHLLLMVTVLPSVAILGAALSLAHDSKRCSRAVNSQLLARAAAAVGASPDR